MENCIGVTYTATQSTLELFQARLHSQLFIKTLFKLEVKTNARLQDCIGVTYTATQSTLRTIQARN